MATARKTTARKTTATKATTKATPAKAKAGAPSHTAMAKAHKAVVVARTKRDAANVALANAATPAAKAKATHNVITARENLSAAMANRVVEMRRFREAGGMVKTIQEVCEFSSSGAALFAVNGGSKTPYAGTTKTPGR